MPLDFDFYELELDDEEKFYFCFTDFYVIKPDKRQNKKWKLTDFNTKVVGLLIEVSFKTKCSECLEAIKSNCSAH